MSRLLVQLCAISHTFGSQPLFDDVSLSVHAGDLIALIGENGSGKSTLLSLLAGQIAPDSGEAKRGPFLTIGHLPQEIPIPCHSLSARQLLEEGSFRELELQMEACLLDPDRLDEWAELHCTYERLGGYRRIPLEQVLDGLKIDSVLLDRPMAHLSSGQRVRTALAQALLNSPDLLLLDEPTNHLDDAMTAWLEEMLCNRQGATVLVSHDRRFLNATCSRLVELKQAKLSCYEGNYDAYLAEKECELARNIASYEAQKQRKDILRRDIKAVSFSKSKPAPCKDRNMMAYDKRGEKHQQSLHRRLDAMKAELQEIEENPLAHPKPKTVTGLRFTSPPLSTPVAMELDHLTYAVNGRTLFSNFSGSLMKGDRVVLTGPNGCGKTTLLKCILGINRPDSGTIYVAPSLRLGYLDQELQQLPDSETPALYFERLFQLEREQLRSELHKAASGGADLLERPFNTMSVGQRKRFMLFKLILEKPNVLLLDEPTNHIDLVTLEALEKALLAFEGALLAVSHDQTFITKIATQQWRLS